MTHRGCPGAAVQPRRIFPLGSWGKSMSSWQKRYGGGGLCLIGSFINESWAVLGALPKKAIMRRSAMAASLAILDTPKLTAATCGQKSRGANSAQKHSLELLGRRNFP